MAKCKQNGEIGLDKLVSLPSETPSKVVTQNVGKATLFYHYDPLGSQTKAPRFHIDLSLAGPIRGISYIILVDSYSKWPEVILIKSATTGIVINSLFQIFANQGTAKVITSRNVTHFSSTRFGDFVVVLISPFYALCLVSTV